MRDRVKAKRMKRFILLPLLFCMPLMTFGQEVVTPLASNPYLKQEGGKKGALKAQQDSSYLSIYPLDTLSLPLKDDFSQDRFKPYSTDTSASGVRDSTFYRIFDTTDQVLFDTIGTWPMDTVGWSLDTTFTYHYDTSNGDTVLDAKTPLPSRKILVNDLWTKAHDTVRYEVWPALVVRDSLWGPPLDTSATGDPDFVQDSLPVFYFPTDSMNIWSDEQVFLNHSLSEDPPSIGFATFDGLDEEGLPYDFNDPYAYGEADHLSSKPIDMSYTPLDSVFLSFFYQRKGLGNAPEAEDSLVLEYYAPSADEWRQVWSKDGGSATEPRQVLVPVEDPDFLQPGFRFRFKNFATLSGGFDHWHLDYVRLQKDRNPNDTAISDIAFTRKPSSFLKNYSSVPWHHYEQDSGHVGDAYTSHHRNLDVAGRFVEFTTRAFFEGNEIWMHDQGVDANVQPNSTFTHDNLTGQSPSDLEFFPSLTGTTAVFDVALIERTNPDTTASNDSITFEQRFENYYAYDDGTAEVAYGISPSGINTPKIAQRFDPYVADTLVGAFIHFAPAFEDKSKESFFLTVWNDDGGTPGSQLYQNISFSNPDYGSEQAQFVFYPFDDPVPMNNSDAFFIGVDQTTQARINLGMDRNNDRSQRIYYNEDGTWSNTGLSGCLMIRPVFASDINIVHVQESEAREELEFSLYPNPSRGRVQLRSPEKDGDRSLTVFAPNGQRIMERQGVPASLDLSDQSPGLYLIRILDEGSGRSTVKKLMLQR